MNRFIFTVVCASVLLASAHFSKALAKDILQTPTSTTSAAQTIQYDLAFPGILPDNFLYKVKVFRDKIQLVMTTDSTKRIELLLKNADKGILATAMLVDKKEYNIAKETALKAENNMTLLTPEISRLEEPIDQSLINKLKTASLKHQEVLTSLLVRVPQDTQIVFSQVIDFSKRNLEQIDLYANPDSQ